MKHLLRLGLVMSVITSLLLVLGIGTAAATTVHVAQDFEAYSDGENLAGEEATFPVFPLSGVGNTVKATNDVSGDGSKALEFTSEIDTGWSSFVVRLPAGTNLTNYTGMVFYLKVANTFDGGDYGGVIPTLDWSSGGYKLGDLEVQVLAKDATEWAPQMVYGGGLYFPSGWEGWVKFKFDTDLIVNWGDAASPINLAGVDRFGVWASDKGPEKGSFYLDSLYLIMGQDDGATTFTIHQPEPTSGGEATPTTAPTGGNPSTADPGLFLALLGGAVSILALNRTRKDR